MTKYGVTLPVTGSTYVEVEASNEEEAISLALESENLNDFLTWEVHRHATRGSVFYGDCHTAEASIIDD